MYNNNKECPVMRDLQSHILKSRDFKSLYEERIRDFKSRKTSITSKLIPENRYTKSFMSDKVMQEKILFPNRKAAWDWEFGQNQISRGPFNKNMH